ncbi:MAG: hypothetical protein PHG66_03510 [Candidatus Colwellbacteria bacterium]|nr:hypothetical protein [Candidatus Colwellbacteria bacterium]
MKGKYIDEYASFLRSKALFKRSVRIVFDCSNGYAGDVIKATLKGVLNIKPIYLNAKPDGDFPGHGPNPMIPEAMATLSDEVIKNNADMGVAFDGDADRAIFVDDKGREIDPDMIFKFYAEKKKIAAMVADVRTGWAIRERTKIRLVISKVGHYFIKKEMIANKIDFGAERAGHYYFKIKGAYMDGAILMALSMASAISSMGSISAWIDSQEQHRIPETNFSVGDKDKVISDIRRNYSRKKPKISELDGLSMEFKDFWFNIRASSNDPVIRLNLEARSEDVLQKELRVLESLIQGKR